MYMCVRGVNYVLVDVFYGCERSCICVLGSYICVLWVLIMSLYMCVRGVNYVPVYVY